MQRGTAESFGMGVSARLPEAIGVVHISESSSQTPPTTTTDQGTGRPCVPRALLPETGFSMGSDLGSASP